MKKLTLLLPLAIVLWPVPAFASELENQLFESCAKQASTPRSQCSCQAKKWASQRVQSFEQPTTFFRIGEHYLSQLKRQWYSPQLMSSSNLNGDQAIMAMLGLNIGVSCMQEEYPVFQSRVQLD